jgi:hypothetical protein
MSILAHWSHLNFLLGYQTNWFSVHYVGNFPNISLNIPKPTTIFTVYFSIAKVSPS